MRPVILALLLIACGGPAEAADLWLDVDHAGPTEEIHLHLPANWLTQAEEPVWIETEAGKVDLRQEAVALKKQRAGTQKRWELDKQGSDPVTLVLETRTATGAPATGLSLQTRGPKGNGLTATMELTADQVGHTAGHLSGVLDVQGVEVDLNQAMCDQLKASPPVVLLETTGPKGGGLTLATR